LDRIDIHLEVPRVAYEKLSDHRHGEASAVVQPRVEAARGRQRARFHKSKLASNAEMQPAQVRSFCQLDEAGRNLMRSAMDQLQLTARGYHRVLKVARTIADLAEAERIEAHHLAEALQYRTRAGDV
jgi:magnesium chelatase family protein